MNGNDLLELHAQEQAEKLAAREAEAEKVKLGLVSLWKAGQITWFGDFSAELEDNPEKNSSFYCNPSGNRDVDASLTVELVWRGLRAQIYLSAKKQLATTMRTYPLTGHLAFVWDPEITMSGAHLQYRKELSLDLPVKNDLADGWIYAVPSEAVPVRRLAAFLSEALATHEERQKISKNNQEREIEFKKQTFAREIGMAEGFESLRKWHLRACEQFPEEHTRWEQAMLERLDYLNTMQTVKENHAKQVSEAVAWLENWKSVLLANRAKMVEVQQRYASQKFALYVLEYGIVSEDEDGEKFATTEAMYVSTSEADEAGYWMSLEHKSHLVKVFHPVRLVPISRNYEQLDNCLKQNLWVPECLQYMVFPTWIDPLTVMTDLCDAKLADLPLADGLEIEKGAMSEAADLVFAEIGLIWESRRALERVREHEDDPYREAYR